MATGRSENVRHETGECWWAEEGGSSPRLPEEAGFSRARMTVSCGQVTERGCGNKGERGREVTGGDSRSAVGRGGRHSPSQERGLFGDQSLERHSFYASALPSDSDH